ncbi:MAG: efflux RND transporter periplasmic adaptor subunit [Opitutus sp.]|nr:efflux RND transporter periplasmic adaptor subunit [Opitutus sp.]
MKRFFFKMHRPADSVTRSCERERVEFGNSTRSRSQLRVGRLGWIFQVVAHAFALVATLLVGVRLSTAAHAAAAAMPATAIYQCPMHPWIKSAKPAKCTICGMNLAAAQATGLPLPEGMVSLAASIINTIGVETSVVSRQALLRTVRVNGAIDDDDTRHRLLTAWAEGRVEKLHVNVVGTVIKAGQPLFDLYSPELQAAQRELVQLARAGELAAAALPAARERLRKMSLTDAQLDELLASGAPKLVTTVLAPDDGTIVEKTVYEGQWLKTGDKLFAIGDFSKMWFLFDAYEQDIPWLRVGQKVEITTRAVPGEIIEAPIDFIDPNFNEMTRTTKVRVVLTNPHLNTASGEGHLLFHRVLAEARVLVESPAVLAAPRTAILDAGRGPVAYVDLGAGNYGQRKLRLGRRGDSLVEVFEGLAEGEKVVTTGALLIDAQAQLAQEASGHSHAGAAGRAGPLGPPVTPVAIDGAPSSRALPQSELALLANAAIDAAGALAADDYASYRKLFPGVEAVAKSFSGLPRLDLGDNLKSARRSFEPWSTAVADLLKPHKAHLGLKFFQCSMSPVLGKGLWVQRSQPLKNPFFGSAMANCGSELP